MPPAIFASLRTPIRLTSDKCRRIGVRRSLITVQASSIFKAILLCSGWGVAAWLLLSRLLEPVTRPLPKEQGTPMPRSSNGNPIESAFLEWSADPALAGALVGFCVLDPSGKTVFASPLAGTALCPASALKTLTTAAALEVLGSNKQFTTQLVQGGEITPSGQLNGGLLISGGGDPTFSSSDLATFTDAVVKAGIKQINGKVEAGYGGKEYPVSDHWNWGDIGNAYGAGAYGLNLDHNRIAITFQPASREGDPATLLNDAPPTKDTRWVNQVLTGPAGSGDRVSVYSEPYGRTITLRGTVPLGESGFTVHGAMPDPAARTKEVFRASLEAAGVKVVEGEMPPVDHLDTLVFHKSAELVEIIDHLHKTSDNLEAQCLFLAVGSAAGSDPAEAVRNHWESRGVSFTGLRMIDGSGLARANMIRPLDLARVNHLARRGPHGERFRQSLTGYLDSKVRSKLGAMSGVKTEVGFLALDDGREVTFALMANGLGLDVDFWPLRDRLLRDVAASISR